MDEDEGVSYFPCIEASLSRHARQMSILTSMSFPPFLQAAGRSPDNTDSHHENWSMGEGDGAGGSDLEGSDYGDGATSHGQSAILSGALSVRNQWPQITSRSVVVNLCHGFGRR
jgi:hypothetical protein